MLVVKRILLKLLAICHFYADSLQFITRVHESGGFNHFLNFGLVSKAQMHTFSLLCCRSYFPLETMEVETGLETCDSLI